MAEKNKEDEKKGRAKLSKRLSFRRLLKIKKPKSTSSLNAENADQSNSPNDKLSEEQPQIIPTKQPLVEHNTPTQEDNTLEPPLSESHSKPQLVRSHSDPPLFESHSELPLSESHSELPLVQSYPELPLSESLSEQALSQCRSEPPLPESHSEQPLSEAHLEPSVVRFFSELPLSESHSEQPLAQLHSESEMNKEPESEIEIRVSWQYKNAPIWNESIARWEEDNPEQFENVVKQLGRSTPAEDGDRGENFTPLNFEPATSTSNCTAARIKRWLPGLAALRGIATAVASFEKHGAALLACGVVFFGIDVSRSYHPYDKMG